MRRQFNLQDYLKDKSQKVETRDGRIVHNIWPVKEPLIFNDKRAEVCALIDGEEDALVFFEGGKYLTVNSESPFDLFIVTPEPELNEFENRLCEILDYAINHQIHSTDEETIKEAKELAHELFDLARTELIFQGNIILSTEESKKRFAEAQEKGRKEAFHDAVENISDEHQAEMSVEYSIHCKVENGVRHAVMKWDEFQKVAQKFIDIGKAEALKDLQENLANNDIYKVPEWLREVLVMAKENGKKEALKDLPRWKEIRDNGCVDADGDTYTDCLCLLKRGWYQVMSPGTKVGGEIRYISIRDLEKLPGFKED